MNRESPPLTRTTVSRFARDRLREAIRSLGAGLQRKHLLHVVFHRHSANSLVKIADERHAGEDSSEGPLGRSKFNDPRHEWVEEHAIFFAEVQSVRVEQHRVRATAGPDRGERASKQRCSPYLASRSTIHVNESPMYLSACRSSPPTSW